MPPQNPQPGQSPPPRPAPSPPGGAGGTAPGVGALPYYISRGNTWLSFQGWRDPFSNRIPQDFPTAQIGARIASNLTLGSEDEACAYLNVSAALTISSGFVLEVADANNEPIPGMPNAPGSVTVTGFVTIAAGASLTAVGTGSISGRVTIGDGGSLETDLGCSISGGVQLSNGVLNAAGKTIQNSGAISGWGTVTGDITGGTVQAGYDDNPDTRFGTLAVTGKLAAGVLQFFVSETTNSLMTVSDLFSQGTIFVFDRSGGGDMATGYVLVEYSGAAVLRNTPQSFTLGGKTFYLYLTDGATVSIYQAGSITGTVSAPPPQGKGNVPDGNTPVVGATVTATMVNPVNLPVYPPKTATTNALGVYTMTGVQKGLWDVSCDGCTTQADQTVNADAATTVDLLKT